MTETPVISKFRRLGSAKTQMHQKQPIMANIKDAPYHGQKARHGIWSHSRRSAANTPQVSAALMALPMKKVPRAIAPQTDGSHLRRFQDRMA
jgi:hypothetical protein